MIERIANRSALEGFRRSRLPSFTNEEVEYIKGTYDFLALNTYTTIQTEHKEYDIDAYPTWTKDSGIELHERTDLPAGASEWLRVS